MKILFACGIILLLNSFAETFKFSEDSSEPRPPNSDLELNDKQKRIVESYEAIARLEYGEECNPSLEFEGTGLRQTVKDYTKKALASGFKQGMAGKREDELELSPSVEDSRDEVLVQMEAYVEKVKNSKEGFNGICNDTKTLYCDQEVGKCRCGKAQKPKGFNFIQGDAGNCEFNVGSGCIQSDFSDLTTLACKKGTTCVTGIEERECSFENTMDEATKNYARFQQLTRTHGYTCFCNKD